MPLDINSIHKGDFWYLKLKDTTNDVVGCITSISPSFQSDTSEVQNCREDFASQGSWRAYIMGAKSGEIAVEGYVKIAAAWNPVRFFNALDLEALLDFEIYPSEDGGVTKKSAGYEIKGKCWLTNLETSHPTNEIVTYSCTLLINGRPTKTIIP